MNLLTRTLRVYDEKGNVDHESRCVLEKYRLPELHGRLTEMAPIWRWINKGDREYVFRFDTDDVRNFIKDVIKRCKVVKGVIEYTGLNLAIFCFNRKPDKSGKGKTSRQKVRSGVNVDATIIKDKYCNTQAVTGNSSYAVVDGDRWGKTISYVDDVGVRLFQRLGKDDALYFHICEKIDEKQTLQIGTYTGFVSNRCDGSDLFITGILQICIQYSHEKAKGRKAKGKIFAIDKILRALVVHLKQAEN